MLVPRKSLLLCSPSTQRIASATLLFPHPFGPTIAVIPPTKSTTVLSAKDLNPCNSIRFKFKIQISNIYSVYYIIDIIIIQAKKIKSKICFLPIFAFYCSNSIAFFAHKLSARRLLFALCVVTSFPSILSKIVNFGS